MTTALYDTACELSATAADLAAAIDTDDTAAVTLTSRVHDLLDTITTALGWIPALPVNLPGIARQLRHDLDANRRPGVSEFNLLDFQALGVAEEAGELVGAYRRWSGRARRTGTLRELEDEVADVFIVTAVFAERAGINLNDAITRKLAVIYTRGWRDASGAPAGALGCAR